MDDWSAGLATLHSWRDVLMDGFKKMDGCIDGQTDGQSFFAENTAFTRM